MFYLMSKIKNHVIIIIFEKRNGVFVLLLKSENYIFALFLCEIRIKYIENSDKNLSENKKFYSRVCF